MTIYYAIRCGDQYVVGTEPNEKYCSSAKSPTMGTRYDHSEYKTVLSYEPAYFERLTAIGYLRVLMEEFRWGDKKPHEVELIPKE